MANKYFVRYDQTVTRSCHIYVEADSEDQLPGSRTVDEFLQGVDPEDWEMGDWQEPIIGSVVKVDPNKDHHISIATEIHHIHTCYGVIEVRVREEGSAVLFPEGLGDGPADPALDVIASMILAHAASLTIDVEDPHYAEGVESALSAIVNQ